MTRNEGDRLMMYTEEKLKLYASPLSETEQEKCKRAIEMVRDALVGIGYTERGSIVKGDDGAAYTLQMGRGAGGSGVTILVQGSYANNTNIRASSDVDVAVISEEPFVTEYRPGIDNSNYGFTLSDSTPAQFKDEVERALRSKFGGDVERRNKSIRVNGNTYRKDADVVAALRYRDYTGDYSYSAENYTGGIAIYPDRGGRIINYPEQHIELGRKKNVATNRYYKKMVRIAKAVKRDMESAGYANAAKTSSFAVESLLWNVPDERFKRWSLLGYGFEEVLEFLRASTDDIWAFKEANGIKYLCPENGSEEEISKFIGDLASFYSYGA